MRILYIVSEIKPFIQSGGVADVAGKLPAALHQEGIKIEIVAPLYSSMRLGDRLCRLSETLLLEHNCRLERASLFETSLRDIPVTLVRNPTYFENGCDLIDQGRLTGILNGYNNGYNVPSGSDHAGFEETLDKKRMMKNHLSRDFSRPEGFLQLQKTCFFRRFPWHKSARAYIDQVYEPALRRNGSEE